MELDAAIHALDGGAQEMPRQKRVVLEDGRQVQFMGQDESTSTIESMVEAIASRGVERMTCVSPFFDQNASGLKSLTEGLKAKNVDVLFDRDRVPFEPYSGPQFFHWNSRWVEDDKSAKGRLNAKLYHFILTDGAEALYAGRSNATMAGLGCEVLGHEMWRQAFGWNGPSLLKIGWMNWVFGKRASR